MCFHSGNFVNFLLIKKTIQWCNMTSFLSVDPLDARLQSVSCVTLTMNHQVEFLPSLSPEEHKTFFYRLGQTMMGVFITEI